MRAQRRGGTLTASSDDAARPHFESAKSWVRCRAGTISTGSARTKARCREGGKAGEPDEPGWSGTEHPIAACSMSHCLGLLAVRSIGKLIVPLSWRHEPDLRIDFSGQQRRSQLSLVARDRRSACDGWRQPCNVHGWRIRTASSVRPARPWEQLAGWALIGFDAFREAVVRSAP